MSDLDLLRQYVRDDSQAAFRALVERHVDLVYSAARRQVRSPDLAHDVVQAVFLDLARQAGRFPAAQPLAPWLYTVTRRKAIDLQRSESRRLAREIAAAELAAMETSPAWNRLAPLVDEAMHRLSEDDRTALVLRYFQSLELREVGRMLGLSDDTAQKRVSRALERLRLQLARSGATVAAANLAQELSAHAVLSAPAALTTTISAPLPAALAGAPGTPWLSSWPAKAMLTAGVTALTILLFNQQQELRAQERERRELIALLRHPPATLAPRAIAAAAAKTPAESPAVTLTPRGDLIAGEEIDSRLQQLVARVAQLKRRLLAHPGLAIPDLALLAYSDWIGIAQTHPRLETDRDYDLALSSLRTRAKNRTNTRIQQALKAYVAANGGNLPAELSQLLPHLLPPFEAAILARYELRATGPASALVRQQPVIHEKSGLVLHPRDNIGVIGLDFAGVTIDRGAAAPIERKLQEATMKALGAHRAKTGKDAQPSDYVALLPYFEQPALAEAFRVRMEEQRKATPFTTPSAYNEALQAYRAAHHGSHPARQEDLALFFSDPRDVTAYLEMLKTRPDLP